MSTLFFAHSSLRFLILLAGVVDLALLAVALFQKKPFGKPHRAVGSAFAGLLHLQVLLGIVMVAMGRYYPALIGHMVMMIVAAVAAQATMSINRRRATPTVALPLIGVVIALVCITGGVMAIGRGLFTMTSL